MREYHGGPRHREYFPHNVVRDVGQVDQHPDSIHLVDDCLSIIAKYMITTKEPEFGFSLRIVQLFSLRGIFCSIVQRLLNNLGAVWLLRGYSQARIIQNNRTSVYFSRLIRY
jgi:hypothetical protein